MARGKNSPPKKVGGRQRSFVERLSSGVKGGCAALAWKKGRKNSHDNELHVLHVRESPKPMTRFPGLTFKIDQASGKREGFLQTANQKLLL